MRIHEALQACRSVGVEPDPRVLQALKYVNGRASAGKVLTYLRRHAPHLACEPAPYPGGPTAFAARLFTRP
jgi:hypothetical protein